MKGKEEDMAVGGPRQDRNRSTNVQGRLSDLTLYTNTENDTFLESNNFSKRKIESLYFI